MSDDNADIDDNAGITEFLAARDLLLNTRGDYAGAYRKFSWPRPERFNWALDYFDGVLAAERGGQDALRLIEDDGSEARYTFGQLSTASAAACGCCWCSATRWSCGNRCWPA
jgi:acetyl-CoA synthetase